MPTTPGASGRHYPWRGLVGRCSSRHQGEGGTTSLGMGITRVPPCWCPPYSTPRNLAGPRYARCQRHGGGHISCTRSGRGCVWALGGKRSHADPPCSAAAKSVRETSRHGRERLPGGGLRQVVGHVIDGPSGMVQQATGGSCGVRRNGNAPSLSPSQHRSKRTWAVFLVEGVRYFRKNRDLRTPCPQVPAFSKISNSLEEKNRPCSLAAVLSHCLNVAEGGLMTRRARWLLF